MERTTSTFKLLPIFAVAFFINSGFAQNPTYYLTAKNFNVSGTDNIIDWDIYVEHTNPPTQFQYAGGQYFLAFNPNIANGGTLTYSIIDSDLPVNMRPRNPSVGTATSPSQTILKLAINSFPGAGNGYIMTNNGYPGTKIVRVRLQTSAASFDCSEYLSLSWRNPPVVAFSTKIFAYVGTENTDITTSNSHRIDTSNWPIHTTWVHCHYGVIFDIEGMLDTTTNYFYRSDTVEVQLRNQNSPYNIARIKKDSIESGAIAIDITYLPLVNYYIVLKYRNAIEIWSATPRPLSPPIYIFNDDAAHAYGSNQTLVGNRYCMYSGDVNQDGIIDGTDLSLIDNDAFNFVTGSFLSTDLNGDDFVDTDDLSLCDNNASALVSVKSPLNDSQNKSTRIVQN